MIGESLPSTLMRGRWQLSLTASEKRLGGDALQNSGAVQQMLLLAIKASARRPKTRISIGITRALQLSELRADNSADKREVTLT
jgi:hypothetical protein